MKKIEGERVRDAFLKYQDLLSERERDVISRYYGIDPQVRHTLAEIGEMYDVTRERIRQIKVIALNKLKIGQK